MSDDEINQASALQSAHQDQFIEHPNCTEVLKNLRYVYELSRQKSRPHNLMVIGDAGSGKTSILNYFIQQIEHKRAIADEEVPKLVTKIDMPPMATPARLLAEIASSFGIGYTRSMNLGQFVVRVVERGLRLVLIDEFHNLDSANKTQRAATLQTLKWLGNETGLSLIISGTKNVSRILMHDEQFEKRFKLIQIENWTYGEAFNGFVFTYLHNILETPPTELSQKTLDTLLNHTGGRTHDIVRILSQASYEAVEDNNVRNLEKYIREIGTRTSYV